MKAVASLCPSLHPSPSPAVAPHSRSLLCTVRSLRKKEHLLSVLSSFTSHGFTPVYEALYLTGNELSL